MYIEDLAAVRGARHTEESILDNFPLGMEKHIQIISDCKKSRAVNLKTHKTGTFHSTNNSPTRQSIVYKLDLTK